MPGGYSRGVRAPAAESGPLVSRVGAAMFDSLKVQELFPTPLWVADVGPAKAERLNRDLIAKIRALTEPRVPLGVGGSWQTDPDLQSEPSFAGFRDMVRKVVTGVGERMPRLRRGASCSFSTARIAFYNCRSTSRSSAEGSKPRPS